MASPLDSLTVAYPRVFRRRAARLTCLEPYSSHVTPLLKTDVWVSHCGQSPVQTPSSSLAFKAFLSRPSLGGLRDRLHSRLHLAYRCVWNAGPRCTHPAKPAWVKTIPRGIPRCFPGTTSFLLSDSCLPFPSPVSWPLHPSFHVGAHSSLLLSGRL